MKARQQSLNPLRTEISLRFNDLTFHRSSRRPQSLRLRVPGVMILHSLRQQTLASALPPTRKGGAAAFGFHAGSKTVLTFTRALRCLISAFHSAL
jgi:hypothetical protein